MIKNLKSVLMIQKILRRSVKSSRNLMKGVNMALLNREETEGLYKIEKEVLAFITSGIKPKGGYGSATECDIDPISLPDSIISALLYVDGQELKIELSFQKRHNPIDLDIYISPTDIGNEAIIWEGEKMKDGSFHLNKKIRENVPKIRLPIGNIKKDKHIKNIEELLNMEDTKITSVCYAKK